MKFLQIILPIAVGALIGYCTNYIAIKMLFLPRKEWRIGKHRVPFTPGVIPKNKTRLASAVGTAVSEKLLTENDIVESIKKSGVKDDVVNRIIGYVMQDSTSAKEMIVKSGTEVNVSEATDRVSDALSDKILGGFQKIDMKTVISDVAENSFSELLSNPLVAMLMNSNALDSVYEKIATAIADYINEHGKELLVPMVRQEMDGMLSASLKSNLEQINVDEAYIRKLLENTIDRFIENNAPKLIDYIKIKDIVEEKINQMNVKELEDLVMSVMKNELQAVVNLGAVIGAVIGIINIFI